MIVGVMASFGGSLNDHRGRELLHRRLGSLALGNRCNFPRPTASPAASRFRFGRCLVWPDVRIDQIHCLRSFCCTTLFVKATISSRNSDHWSANRYITGFWVSRIQSPDTFHRNRLGGHLQRRQLFRFDQIMNVLVKRDEPGNLGFIGSE